MYCQAMTTGVKLVVQNRGTAGHEGGKNEAGQDDHGPLHAHADIGLDELLPRETGPFSGEGRQRDRGQGSKNVEKICEEAWRMGIKYLTVYAFSTENWNRPKSEVDALMKLLRNYMKTCLKTAEKNEHENPCDWGY